MNPAPADPILAARAQGEAAFREGKRHQSSPYRMGSPEFAAWARGWQTAKFGASQPHERPAETASQPVNPLQRLQTAFDAADHG